MSLNNVLESSIILHITYASGKVHFICIYRYRFLQAFSSGIMSTNLILAEFEPNMNNLNYCGSYFYAREINFIHIENRQFYFPTPKNQLSNYYFTKNKRF